MLTGKMPIRLLIVDDNPEFLKAARRVLEGDGIQVVGVASTTAEAVSKHSELQPDVTLVDVNLGDEDGVALARTLSGELGPGTEEVILISTYPEQDLADLGETVPTLRFLSKSRLSGAAVRSLYRRSGDRGSGDA